MKQVGEIVDRSQAWVARAQERSQYEEVDV